jgi:methionyl-tRNA formyltransferase
LIRVEILCSDRLHPINAYLIEWASKFRARADVRIARRASELTGGDFLFLVSCHEVVDRATRDHFTHALVVHASDLPRGRGWSPHIWQVLQGNTEITVTLLEAADKIDSGDIWKQLDVHVPDHAICAEINDAIFQAVLDLMDYAVENQDSVVTRPQRLDIEPTYYPHRRPEDSKLDLDKSLAEQFDLLRVADPERYPAYLEFRGHTYLLRMEKK